MPSYPLVVGWEDYNGNRYDGSPSNISKAYGLLVYVPGGYAVGRGDEHFWAFTPFDDWEWDDWYRYIYGLIDMYGQELL